MGDADAKALELRQAAPRASMAKNAFHLVLGQVATTALAIVFSAALGRTLGAGDFGLYFLISSFATFAYVVVDWGQQFYVIREVARTPERGGELLVTGRMVHVFITPGVNTKQPIPEDARARLEPYVG